MEEKYKTLMTSIMFNNHEKFEECIEEHIDYLERISFDEKENNLLHYLTYNDRPKMVYKTFDLLDDKRKADENLTTMKKEWLNRKNKTGLSPIFYSILNGNVVGL